MDLDASYDPKMPDYALWWGQVHAIKAGDTVTFYHGDWDDNVTIEMSKLMVAVSAGYLATHDPDMHDLALGFAKGYSAFVKVMRWGDETPGEYLWARTPFNHDHSYVTKDGRKVSVDYSGVRHVSIDWNAHTVPNETNPYWGSIWVRNLRSQDDVPHILRTTPLIRRLSKEAPDADVRAAATEALAFMEGFANDTITHGYVMRSKEYGQIFIPAGDLASYDYYDALLPNGQCNAKISLSFISNGLPLGNSCGNGIQSQFEQVETSSHYYSYAIVRYFHISAILNALDNQQYDVAKSLIEGFGTRADAMATDPMRAGNGQWDPDMASTLLAAAAGGLPLTADEAKLIQTQFGSAADGYAAWPYWDLWSSSVPDGSYPYTPDNTNRVSIQEIPDFLEYCESPWRNPNSVDPVDCSEVLDPSRWGQ